MNDDFKYIFNEDVWTIYLVDDDDIVISEEGSSATTDFSAKELFFRRGHLGLDVVEHELWHVYMGYCYLGDTDEISLSDMEEITAALFSDKGERIIERSKDIYKKLIELRECVDETSN